MFLIVSAASQILPDTLQAWHETSKNLIKNQTSMSLKITELQLSLQELWKNFSEYRSSQEAQKTYEKEEKIVADFGAKMEAIATDVESMKDHYNSVKEKQNNLQQVFENLKVSLPIYICVSRSMHSFEDDQQFFENADVDVKVVNIMQLMQLADVYRIFVH